MSPAVLTFQALNKKSSDTAYRQGTSGVALIKFLSSVLDQLGDGAEFYDLGASAGYLIFVLRLMGYSAVGGCEIIGASVKDANELGRRYFRHWAPVQHASLCAIRFTERRLRLLYCNNLVFPNDSQCEPWLLRSIERMLIEQSLACSVAMTATQPVWCHREPLEEALEEPVAPRRLEV